MEDPEDLTSDGQVDPCLAGEREQGGSGAYAFGDHAHARQNFAYLAAFAQLDAYLAIAAERARASKHQIAEARETHQRFGFRAQRLGQAGQSGKAPRDPPSKPVGAEA